jgi:hypothetical protein
VPSLVAIETSGNQAYIFASNRLRQNVGASELVLRSCSQWVLEAVAHHGGPGGLWSESTADRVANLRDERRNPRRPIEVVLATSGRALLLVEDARVGRDIVARVTRRALLEAPGLSIAGAVMDVDLGGHGREGIHRAIRDRSGPLGQARGAVTPGEVRFRQLPVVDLCRTTGLPANVYERPTDREEPEEMSLVARSKMRAAALTTGRVRAEKTIRLRERLVDSAARLDECEWLGVIHADGNGMGALLREFHHTVRESEDHVAAVRDFSTGLELLAIEAFDEALAETVTSPDGEIPLVPLVLGGDDLTVVCDGRLALPFTRAYLNAFGERSANLFGARLRERARLTARAGVALVKRHYPLHAAYDLAEDLADGAKLPEPGHSSFDFHVHHDSTGADLRRVRRERRSRAWEREQVALWGGPYVIGAPGHHGVARLEAAVRLLSERRDGRRVFPSTVAHRLRSALTEGKAAADAELKLVLARLDRELHPALLGLGESGSLAHRERDGEPYTTAFVDAMDAADFWEVRPR